MNKLIIEQDSNSRPTSSKVIEELYKYAKVLTGDNISLKGSLTVQRAYKESVDYLNAKFPNLTITVQTGYFMTFKDPEVQRICVENWGQDGGCIPSWIENISNANTYFQNNENIIIADLAAFKNTNTDFSNSSNIKEIYIGGTGYINALNVLCNTGWSGGKTLDKLIVGSCRGILGQSFNGSANTITTFAVKTLTQNVEFHDYTTRNCNITNFYLGGTTYTMSFTKSNYYYNQQITNLYVPSTMVSHYEQLKDTLRTARGTGNDVIVNVLSYDFDTDPDGIFDGLDVTPPSL